MTDTNSQLKEMQEMLSHHEKTIEDLSSQLADQWKTIVDLESKLNILTGRFVALEEDGLPAPQDTRPPHY